MYVTQHSTAAKRTKGMFRELIFTPVGFQEGLVFITKQPKLKDINTCEQFPSSGSRRPAVNCVLRLASLHANCLTLVPDNVSSVT